MFDRKLERETIKEPSTLPHFLCHRLFESVYLLGAVSVQTVASVE